MNTTVDEKLLERIRKLQAKADSCEAIGSLAEAATFAAAVQNMLAKYNLSMEALRVDEWETQKLDLPEQGKRVKIWHQAIYEACADGYGVTVYYHRGSAKALFFGRPDNVRIAVYMAEVLIRTGTALGKRALWEKKYENKRQTGSFAVPEGFRRGWFYGFAVTIRERLLDLTRSESQLGVILYDASRLANAELHRRLKVQRQKTTVNTTIDLDAFRKGQEAAEQIALTPGVEGTPTTQRQLAAGSPA